MWDNDLEHILDGETVTFGIISLLLVGVDYFMRLIYKHLKMNE